MEPVAQMQIFGDEHDFCENQGINDSKTMRHVIYLMLRKNYRFVNGQHAKNYPEI